VVAAMQRPQGIALMVRMTMSLTAFGACCHCFIKGDALKAASKAE